MNVDTSFMHASIVLKMPINAHLAVDWACELLMQGIDTFHLRLLAGLQPDIMLQEETLEMVKKILDELNVPFLSKERAAKIYLITLLRGYLENKFTKYDFLFDLSNMYVVNNINSDFFWPFYLLAHEEYNKGSEVGLYYTELNSYEDIDKWIKFEVAKFLNFLEYENEDVVLNELKDIHFPDYFSG